MLADYAQRVPSGLTNSQAFVARFDGLALGLSLVESLPLAALSYAMATLLHRLAEQETQDTSAITLPNGAVRPAVASAQPVTSVRETVRLVAQSDGVSGQSRQSPIADRTCKHCGVTGLIAIEVARHGRARSVHGHCRSLNSDIEKS